MLPGISSGNTATRAQPRPRRDHSCPAATRRAPVSVCRWPPLRESHRGASLAVDLSGEMTALVHQCGGRARHYAIKDACARLLASPDGSSPGPNARRKPLLLLRLSHLLLLRYAARAFEASLFHEPPRSVKTGHPSSSPACALDKLAQVPCHARTNRPISSSRPIAYSYCATLMSDSRSLNRK